MRFPPINLYSLPKQLRDYEKPMELFTLDFESYYSRTFSLSKLTYDEYINDDQFEVIGVGVKKNSDPTQWFSGTKQETHDWLVQFDLGNNAVIMHNAMFDASILAFHFGIYPKVILDTLAMARALHGVTVGNSLKRLAEYYGVGEKGTEVHNFIDYRRDTFTPQELAAYGEYCKQDVNLTKQIFDLMRSKFNQTELKLIDMTIRMYTEPKFMYDREFLVQHLKGVKDRQQKILDDLNLTASDLRSNPKFAELLRTYGVEPPMKTSPTTGKDTYALAKTDEGMKALLEHENPDVQALAAARLGVKSSLEETRTQRLIDTGDRNNGYLPIGLNYYGARTGRWSATQGLQFQNLPNKSDLKQGVTAPPGYVIIGADLSNIELRVGLWFAGQMDKLQLLQEGKDLYKDFASSVFNVPYDDVDKDQRFIGKTCIAEGELVLTDKGLKPIENVLLDDRVWDGVEWVNHDGLIYQGERDVITYQHLTATPDHIVYLSDGSTCEFQEAANKGYQIVVTGDEGREISLVGDNLARYMQKRQEASAAHTGEMPLWERGLANFGQSNSREEQTMPQLCIDTATWTSSTSTGRRQFNTKIAETGERNASTMYQPKGQRIQKLWSPWYSVYVWFSSRMRNVYENFTKLFDRSYSRPDKQQQPLCSGEPSVYNTKRTNTQSTKYCFSELERSSNSDSRVEGKSVQTIIDSSQIYKSGDDWRTNNNQGLGVCTQQMQRMAQPKRKVRKVYDILNAGPRHRFTVGNLLVSNCSLSLIYGTGSTKLRNAIKTSSGKDIGEIEAKRIVDTYRSDYSDVAGMWRTGGEVISAVANNYGMDFGYNNLCAVDGGTGIRLPSGLHLTYPNLRQQYNDKQKLEWVYDKSSKEIDRVYGAKVFQGTVQALARCVIGESMVRINKKYPLALTLHDANYLTVREQYADEALKFVEDEMVRAPSWLPGIVLGVEGHIGRNLKEV